MREEQSGVITVFFSLIFLMILLLTGSMLHAAYTAGAISAGERILLLSGESVLAKYYRPLYEDYHIFARVLSGEGAGAAERLEDELKEWLNGNLLPGEDGAGTGVLTAQEVDAVRITDVASLLSGDGESFLDQALAYQQYRSLSDAAAAAYGVSGGDGRGGGSSGEEERSGGSLCGNCCG